jgi:fused signal recognition particle receptor
MLEELEELLIASDLGAADAVDMVERVRAEAKRTGALSSQDVRALLRRLLEEALAGSAAPLELVAKPSVMLMLGVNGAGKTTARGTRGVAGRGGQERSSPPPTPSGRRVEQLEEWGRRRVDVIARAAPTRGRPLRRGQGRHGPGVDVLLVDTAGRLPPSQSDGRAVEAEKVVSRQLPGPHDA